MFCARDELVIAVALAMAFPYFAAVEIRSEEEAPSLPRRVRQKSPFECQRCDVRRNIPSVEWCSSSMSLRGTKVKHVATVSQILLLDTTPRSVFDDSEHLRICFREGHARSVRI